MSDRPERLRWGILSTARISEEVIPGLQTSSLNSLTGVASRDLAKAQRFAGRHGIDRAYGSYEDLLADDTIDCVYIPLPNKLHAQWVERAVSVGKHVLCEKPLVSSAEEARRLFELADRAGVHLAEAFMYRHHPKTLALVDLVRSGRLGPVHTIRTSFTFMTEHTDTDIRFNPSLDGGALRDVGSYCVSLSNLLLDAQPTEVQALSVSAASGVAERFYGTMRYAAGAVAQFDCSMLSPLSVRASVQGALGEAVVPMPWYAHLPPHQILLILPDQEPVTVPVPDTNAYYLETEHFAEVVLGERQPVVPAEETIRNVATLELLAASEATSRGPRQQAARISV